MKKFYLIALSALLLFVVTGCGSKNVVKCTGKFEGYEATIEAEFDGSDKLTTVTAVEDVGSKEEADQVCALSSIFEAQGISVSCSGSKVTIKGFEKMVESEDTEDESEQLVGLTKEEFKTYMESSSEGAVTCK